VTGAGFQDRIFQPASLSTLDDGFKSLFIEMLGLLQAPNRVVVQVKVELQI
jgi:hypothetical protein